MFCENWFVLFEQGEVYEVITLKASQV